MEVLNEWEVEIQKDPSLLKMSSVTNDVLGGWAIVIKKWGAAGKDVQSWWRILLLF